MRSAGELQIALETSSRRGSVAVGRGGETLAWHVLAADRTHTAELHPALADLLASVQAQPQDVGLICFSHGPGSFTGLRVAATIARTWQSVTGAQVVAVPSLEVIARNALRMPDPPPRLAVILDARQGQVFGALFETATRSLQTVSAAARHDAAAWLPALPRLCAVLGDGCAVHGTLLTALGLPILPEELWLPDAREVLALGHELATAGRVCRPEQITPLYLRPPECEEVYDQRRAAARQRRQHP